MPCDLRLIKLCLLCCTLGALLAYLRIHGEMEGAPQVPELLTINNSGLDLGSPLSLDPATLGPRGSLQVKVYTSREFDAPPIHEGIHEASFNIISSSWLRQVTKPHGFVFALKMDGYLKIDTDAVHTLSISADNGFRIQIEDAHGHISKVDHWDETAGRNSLMIFKTKPGFYRIRIEHFTDGGDANLTALFESPDIDFYPLSPEKTSP